MEAALIEEDGGTCTYELSCGWNTQCLGRPILRGGRPVLAGDDRRRDWGASILPELDGLDEAERRTLAEHWLRAARHEHSSIAGFHRFALELLAHGAPPELVRRAQEAATQEIGHATAAFALASAYAGEPVGPGPLDLGASVPLATSLVELAVSTAREGAIGETVAALVAAAQRDAATDPAVRRVLEVVAEEEAAHAALAWRTLAWAIERGGEPVVAALREVFAGIELPAPTGGLLSSEAEAEVLRLGVERVVRPVAAALLRGERSPLELPRARA